MPRTGLGSSGRGISRAPLAGQETGQDARTGREDRRQDRRRQETGQETGQDARTRGQDSTGDDRRQDRTRGQETTGDRTGDDRRQDRRRQETRTRGREDARRSANCRSLSAEIPGFPKDSRDLHGPIVSPIFTNSSGPIASSGGAARKPHLACGVRARRIEKKSSPKSARIPATYDLVSIFCRLSDPVLARFDCRDGATPENEPCSTFPLKPHFP